MMDCLTILAQTAESASQGEDVTVPMDFIWEGIISLNLVEALTFISFGTICLFYGWRVFKILVIISFALLGLFLGIKVSDTINGFGNRLLSGVIGLGLFAILSVPLMRWAVSLLGAIAGGTLTAGLWYACEQPEQYIWIGGLVGLVAGGMISFIVFKIAIMLFSSLGGSGLIVTGSLALLYLYPQTTEQVEELIFNQKWFLPVMLIVPTIIGVAMQNKFVKSSKDWDI